MINAAATLERLRAFDVRCAEPEVRNLITAAIDVIENQKAVIDAWTPVNGTVSRLRRRR